MIILISAFKREPQVVNLGRKNLLELIVAIEHSCEVNLCWGWCVDRSYIVFVLV